MSQWTLDEAKQHLSAWLQADLALATSEEYQMGNGQRLRRADLATVKDRITFWSNQVSMLSAQAQGKSSGARRIHRVVPRDL